MSQCDTAIDICSQSCPNIVANSGECQLGSSSENCKKEDGPVTFNNLANSVTNSIWGVTLVVVATILLPWIWMRKQNSRISGAKWSWGIFIAAVLVGGVIEFVFALNRQRGFFAVFVDNKSSQFWVDNSAWILESAFVLIASLPGLFLLIALSLSSLPWVFFFMVLFILSFVVSMLLFVLVTTIVLYAHDLRGLCSNDIFDIDDLVQTFDLFGSGPKINIPLTIVQVGLAILIVTYGLHYGYKKSLFNST